jgi:hypothetical protein
LQAAVAAERHDEGLGAGEEEGPVGEARFADEEGPVGVGAAGTGEGW